jgi:hypothetical protein
LNEVTPSHLAFHPARAFLPGTRYEGTMSKPIAQIVLLQCDACADDVRVRQRRYVRRFLGRTINVPVELAACVDCNTVVECESIPESVAVLHALKAETLREAETLGYVGWPDDQGWPSEAEIDEQIRFLPHRLGAARCLTCEGTSLEHARPGPSGNPAVPHLGCEGAYMIVGLDYVDDLEDTISLDIEGTRIRTSG